MALVGPRLIRLWMGTVTTRWILPGFHDQDHRQLRNSIFVLWHQQVLLFAKSHRNTGLCALISAHGDGQLIAGILERLGYEVVRGSSTRGGVQAMKELLATPGNGCGYAITPDGPRGPLRVFQPGAIFFASRSGLALMPVHVGYDHCWHLPTWDRFLIPRPFSRCVVNTREVVRIPPDLDREEIETWRQRMEISLHELAAETEENFDALYEQGLSEREVLSMWREEGA